MDLPLVSRIITVPFGFEVLTAVTTNSTISWKFRGVISQNITLLVPVYTGFLLYLLLDPEDGGDMSRRNVGLCPEPQMQHNFFFSFCGWGETVHLVRRPLLAYCTNPGWLMMIMEQLVEWGLAGETEVLGENLPQCHFVHHKSDLTWDRTRAAAVGSRRLTAWAMARPSDPT
jgi:hypothetical protein